MSQEFPAELFLQHAGGMQLGAYPGFRLIFKMGFFALKSSESSRFFCLLKWLLEPGRWNVAERLWIRWLRLDACFCGDDVNQQEAMQFFSLLFQQTEACVSTLPSV